MCPTRALSLNDDNTMDVDNKSCVRCMHCINVMTGALAAGTDKGVTDRLISVASPVAGRAEVHTHIMDGNVMKMRRVEALDLKDGTSHVLKPMGDHIMLFDLKQPLKEGDLIKIALTFEKAGVVEVEGTVEPVGAMGPHGMDHQPMLDDTPSKGDTPDGKSGHEHMGHH